MPPLAIWCDPHLDDVARMKRKWTFLSGIVIYQEKQGYNDFTIAMLLHILIVDSMGRRCVQAANAVP